VKRPWPRRTLILAAVLLAVDLAGARALDALGLVESLLAPGSPRAFVAFPLAVLFYAARISLLFLVPGIVIGALLFTRKAPKSGEAP
jgi:hypothetical protein